MSETEMAGLYDRMYALEGAVSVLWKFVFGIWLIVAFLLFMVVWK